RHARAEPGAQLVPAARRPVAGAADRAVQPELLQCGLESVAARHGVEPVGGAGGVDHAATAGAGEVLDDLVGAEPLVHTHHLHPAIGGGSAATASTGVERETASTTGIIASCAAITRIPSAPEPSSCPPISSSRTLPGATVVSSTA